MRIPLDWLKEFVKINISAKELAERLTMAGLETQVVDRNILDVDVLPNRGDCLSIIGIAREIAAIINVKCQMTNDKLIKSKSKIQIKIQVKDKKLCPRYMACLIEGVKVGPSPKWMQERLIAAGFRPVNNIVDITNYLLFEMGQPMHAFDNDKLKMTNDKLMKIIIRKAKTGDKIITIDGVERKLGKDMLVIANAEKPIAVAGVMGGAETEVSDSTTSILLESAYFNPISVNKTSKALKLRTESSIRFERGVDWDGVERALDRCAQMIVKVAGGEIKGKVNLKAVSRKPKAVSLKIERVNQILGTKLSSKEIAVILGRLGFRKLKVESRKLKIGIPSFRAGDIEREIDIIEEIARIYGYDNITETMPHTSFGQAELENSDDLQQKIREVLAGYGLSEVKTYSMISPKLFEKTKLSTANVVRISNPLSEEESIMRTSLVPSLLQVVDYNLRHKNEAVAIFEIGKVYSSKAEKFTLAGVILNSDFLYLKGAIEELLNQWSLRLNVSAPLMEPRSSFAGSILHPKNSAAIPGFGYFGALHPDIQKNFDLAKEVYIFEIDLEPILRLEKKDVKYKPLPKFPASVRDIAMFIPAGVTHQQIIDIIKEVGGALIEEVALFDRYQNSLAYHITYRDPSRTLTDEEVNKKHEEISQSLVSKLKVGIRK